MLPIVFRVGVRHLTGETSIYEVQGASITTHEDAAQEVRLHIATAKTVLVEVQNG